MWRALRDLLGVRIRHNDTRVRYVLNKEFPRGILHEAVDSVLRERKAREQRLLNRVSSWNMYMCMSTSLVDC